MPNFKFHALRGETSKSASE